MHTTHFPLPLFLFLSLPSLFPAPRAPPIILSRVQVCDRGTESADGDDGEGLEFRV